MVLSLGQVFWNTIGKWIYNKLHDLYTSTEKQRKQNVKKAKLEWIKGKETTKALDYYYEHLPEEQREDPEIKEAYDDRREELEAQGYNTYSDLAAGWIGTNIAKGIWKVTEVSADYIIPWIDEVGEYYNIEIEEREKLKALAGSGEFGLNAVIGFFLGVAIYPAISAYTEPIWLGKRQDAYDAHRNTMLAPAELLRLKWRYSGNTKYKNDMHRYGYSDDNLKDFERVNKYYPTAGDFIRFAVREAFDDDVAARYGYDEAFPENIVPYAAKAGMDREWLKYHWRSHWEMVSPRIAYEMLHRGQISVDDLRNILRIADYPPFLIDPLINISYRPYTRVDVRRMFREGILSRAEMKQAYLELGYNDEKAENMTAWSVAYARSNERELTRSLIVKSYKMHEKSRDDAKGLLEGLGYDTEEAELILSIEDHKLIQDERDDIIDALQDRFKAGAITYTEFEDALNGLNLQSTYTAKLLAKAQRDKQRKEKHLPFKMYEALFTNGRITEEEFKAYMQGEGFTKRDIDLYFNNTDILVK